MKTYILGTEKTVEPQKPVRARSSAPAAAPPVPPAPEIAASIVA